MEKEAFVKKISDSFALEDLRGLVFNLNIDYEEIPGETKSAKIRGLVQYCENRRQTEQLIVALTQARPQTHWGWPQNNSNSHAAEHRTKTDKSLGLDLVLSILVLFVIVVIIGTIFLLFDDIPSTIASKITPLSREQHIPTITPIFPSMTSTSSPGVGGKVEQAISIEQLRVSNAAEIIRLEVSVFNPATHPVVLKKMDQSLLLGAKCTPPSVGQGGVPNPLYALDGLILVTSSSQDDGLTFSGEVFENNDRKYPFQVSGTIMDVNTQDSEICYILRFTFNSSLIIPPNHIQKFFIEIPKSLEIQRGGDNDPSHEEIKSNRNQTISEFMLNENLQSVVRAGITITDSENNEAEGTWPP